MTADRLGRAVVEPDDPVVAGAWTTVRLVYTAGHPIDDTGYVKIVFRYASDFGRPQFDDPAAPNYCTVQTTGDCRIEPRWDPKGHTRPWGRALYLQVRGGFLDTSETISVVFGDRSGGSRGWQVQTFCEDDVRVQDARRSHRHVRVQRAAPVARRCASCPASLRGRSVSLPQRLWPVSPFAYYLKLEDRWGNPTAHARALTHPGFDQPAVRTLRATDEATGLSAESNPIDVLAEERPAHGYWADLHGQSEETIGSNTIDDYYAFARDVSLLDIAAHQGNDFQVTDAFWQMVNDKAQAFNEAGRFVTFPGYEWSGNTPLGGDRNVYFAREGGAIVHSCADLLPDKRSAYATALTAADLFEALAGQQGPRAFAFAHVGGRYADLRMHDPEIELARRGALGVGHF